MQKRELCVLRGLALAVVGAIAATGAVAQTSDLMISIRRGAPVQIVGDGIAQPVSNAIGDVERGRALIVARDPANCVLCHAVPEPAVRFAGDIGPSLAAVGARLTAAQLRLRIVDNQHLNPATIMPSYYRVENLQNVATAYRGKPVLTAQQVEDVVVYLGSLR